MHVYVEVIRLTTNKVTHRVDCHGDTRRAERVEDGMLINMNHEEFCTKITSYDTPQEINPKDEEAAS